MDMLSSEMKHCVAECLKCYSTCLSMATHHCLAVGGKHVERQHFTLMLACAEICRTSAHMMLLGAPGHKETCEGCARICEACAKSCEAVGDMDGCVAACRACADSCRKMAG